MYGSVEMDKSDDPSSAQRPLLGKPASARRQPSSKRVGLERRASSRKKLPPARQKSSKPVLAKVFETKPTKPRPLSPEQQQQQPHHEHTYVYTLLNPRSSQPQAVLFKRFIATTIIVDLLFFIVSTEPNIPQDKRHIFQIMEGVTSSIFLVEYMARLVTCMERRKFSKYGAIMGRLRYMITPSALIDAFATFPFFIESCTGFPMPTLTYLRVFRLLRILKTQGYAQAMDAVTRVIYYNREILYVALLVCIFLVLITAVLMYYLRPQNPADADDFSSIAATMYLSTLMLTGQGGPDGDLPWYTKGIVLVTGFFSVAMFAIPASMLTWGFEAEAARLAARARKRSVSRRSGNLEDSSSSSSSYSDDDSSSLDTSDEEYQKIIAGAEDSDTEDDAIKTFQKFDVDQSGALTMAEFVKLQQQEKASSGIHFRGPHFASAAAAATSDSWKERMEQLEEKVEHTNKKLDQILELLQAKNM